MDFIANTEENRKRMLAETGVSSVDELFADIPEKAKLKRALDLPEPLSEQELLEEMEKTASKNRIMKTLIGAGAYHHFVPEVVNHIILRSEFLTAYTPYQAEISQGMLQAIYEYQSMICELTGMDASNASMYDGASACAEAMIMARSIKGKNSIAISRTIHPEYREVVKTYAKSRGVMVHEIGYENGTTSLEELKKAASGNIAGVIVQSPNFFGLIEPLDEIGKIAHNKDALFIVTITEPTSLGLLKPPGEFGADIVVGEGQSFGAGLNFGGPYLGILAAKNEYLRYMPGRLSGKTVDAEGRIGFVLTMQAREQHIRREKALSNICTNVGLVMLAASVYLALMGKELKTLAELNLARAHHCFWQLTKLPGIKPAFSGPFYNEFLLKVDSTKDFFKKLADNGFAPGIEINHFYPELKNHLLLCVTEMIKKEDIDEMVRLLR